MFRLFLSLLFATAATAAFAQEKKPDDKKPPRIAINDPAKLKDDADYAVQGEYVGEFDNQGMKMKIAIQVVADGGGKFRTATYNGGLPGDGWDGKPAARDVVGETKDGKVVFNAPKARKNPVGELAGSELKLSAGVMAFALKKVDRTSPTLGAKPPEGAVVLFGGAKDVDNWENGKLVKLSDGEFLGATNCRSKKAFQSFTAHVEFRLAWMPNARGQGRSNSGVYVQARYELQVLDSFGLTGENNECGGFYTLSKPKVNMCYPPMVWQTYDIEYTAATFDGEQKSAAAKATVKHNGVVVQDGFEFPKATPGGKFNKEVAAAGGLFFQDHGDPVVYRNVWVVEKK